MTATNNIYRKHIKDAIVEIRKCRSDRNSSILTSHNTLVRPRGASVYVTKLGDTEYNHAGNWETATRWEPKKAELVAQQLSLESGKEYETVFYGDVRDHVENFLLTMVTDLLKIRNKY